MTQPARKLKHDFTDSLANDSLGRQNKAEVLTKFVGTISEPFVLSLEAPWGVGKTTFLKHWEKELEKAGHIPLYINAWETDFATDPLAPLATAFIEASKKTDVKDKFKPTISAFGKAILASSARSAVAKAFMLDIKDIKKDLESQALQAVALFEGQKETYQKLKEQLVAFAKAVREESQGKSKVVVLLDELDRCRPSYAIEMLERIKHIFEVDGFVFVLAIDRQQLNASVRHTFGLDTTTEEYLGRFIDMRIELPRPKPEEYFKLLNKQYQLAPLGASLLYRMCDTAMNEIFNLSLRTQAQLFLKMRALSRWHGEMDEYAMILMPFMVALHHADRKFFERLAERRDIDELADYLEERGAKLGYTISNPCNADEIVKTMLYYSLGNRQESKVMQRYQANNCNMSLNTPYGASYLFDNIYKNLKDLEWLA